MKRSVKGRRGVKVNLEFAVASLKRGGERNSGPWNSFCLSRTAIRDELLYHCRICEAFRITRVYPMFRGPQRAAAPPARKASASSVQLARYANSRKKNSDDGATHWRKRRPKLSGIFKNHFSRFSR